jgi:hypothetical protein
MAEGDAGCRERIHGDSGCFIGSPNESACTKSHLYLRVLLIQLGYKFILNILSRLDVYMDDRFTASYGIRTQKYTSRSATEDAIITHKETIAVPVCRVTSTTTVRADVMLRCGENLR